LPSLRSVAREQRVSLITVQRAYRDLEGAGLIYSQQGRGFFVSPLTAKRRRLLAEEGVREALAAVIHGALSEGLPAGAVRRLVDEILEEERDG
jgi:GntR family transcriptional regulator